MKAAKRVAKLPAQRGTTKNVASLDAALPGSGNSGGRICWRFTHVDHDGPWGIAKLPPGEWEFLLRKLAEVETQTLMELFNKGEEPGKHYETHRLPNKDALRRLAELKLNDMTRISRLRFGGRQRLYGFLVDNVFHVVWWDREHEVWPSQKKNT
ncbi:hypothetical protein AB0D10_05295 [Kitasatospora sp. NPDC048545]|uniref:hypothetical protein n=1 Tax=Kitasatospora sp. NPDC048545 TaxID=3157208 RepID=UPI0033E66751